MPSPDAKFEIGIVPAKATFRQQYRDVGPDLAPGVDERSAGLADRGQQRLLDEGYVIVDVSREGFDESPEHSGDSVVRGTLPL